MANTGCIQDRTLEQLRFLPSSSAAEFGWACSSLAMAAFQEVIHKNVRLGSFFFWHAQLCKGYDGFLPAVKLGCRCPFGLVAGLTAVLTLHATVVTRVNRQHIT